MLDYVKTAKWTLVILLACAGCQYAQLDPGDPNQPIVVEPNMIAALESAAQTVMSIGAVLGQAKLVAIGAALVAVIGLLKRKPSKAGAVPDDKRSKSKTGKGRK